jgi:hypothetical protein
MPAVRRASSKSTKSRSSTIKTGVGAKSIGSVLFRVSLAAPEDALIGVSLTDVRCQGTSAGCVGGALSDYTGDLRFDMQTRWPRTAS